MPYRHAHKVILLLVPLILWAFWPGYFGMVPTAAFALHAHGITASCWIALVAAQSWTIHARRNALHRTAGLAVFILAPLFTGAAALAMQSMAGKFAGGADSFVAEMGPRLGLYDLLSTIAFVALVRGALIHRRRIASHAAHMLATVLLVVPPILERILPIPFHFHASDGIALVVGLILWRLRPGDGRPFLWVATLSAVQIIQLETVGQSAAWTGIFVQLISIPSAALAGGAILVTALILWRAWLVRGKVVVQPSALAL
ncbi:hypothetical protein [Sphingobium boeckii]|uniref:Uncharacterized protein n=1 Tax=Sphingobium boeckii TaxID=1082345 RepID=A0A7W9AKE1_9SPHN|nr:hypothetical protein [Sphingobium boeckii]MBB5687270.1 hypothetical protein [Sphingobium boeckii]